MHTIICGPGYTGKRVTAALRPGKTSTIGRPAQDLDDPDVSVILPSSAYTLLYTIPPAADGEGDVRLERLLGMLDPAPKKLVYLSTSGVYGDRDGAITSEAVEPRPGTARAKRRLVGESLITEWCSDRMVAFVILRVPGIYGPGRLGIDRIRSGVPVIRESEAGPGNRIHVDDLVACCIHALDADSASGVFNVGDGDHRSSTWFTKAVARLAGLEAPPEVSRDDAEKSFSEARLSFLRESRILDTTRMREVLGFTPRYVNPEDGIRASLP